MSSRHKPFGNLDFSQWTLSTEAERHLVSLQAALVALGKAPSHPSMKKLTRLRRSMTRNKWKRYSFHIFQAEKPEQVKNEPEAEVLDFSWIHDLIQELSGMDCSVANAKRASSGHVICSFELTGTLRTENVERLREQIQAAAQLSTDSFVLSSCTLTAGVLRVSTYFR